MHITIRTGPAGSQGTKVEHEVVDVSVGKTGNKVIFRTEDRAVWVPKELIAAAVDALLVTDNDMDDE